MKELIQFLLNSDESATFRANILEDLAAHSGASYIATQIMEIEAKGYGIIYISDCLSISYLKESWSAILETQEEADRVAEATRRAERVAERRAASSHTSPLA